MFVDERKLNSSVAIAIVKYKTEENMATLHRINKEKNMVCTAIHIDNRCMYKYINQIMNSQKNR